MVIVGAENALLKFVWQSDGMAAQPTPQSRQEKFVVPFIVKVGKMKPHWDFSNQNNFL